MTAWVDASTILQRAVPLNLEALYFNVGSTTQWSRVQFQETPQVKFLQQNWRLPCLAEQQWFSLSSEQPIFSRETYLCVRAKTWMYARAIFPENFFAGARRALLQQLDARLLGEFLFNEPNMRRSAFEFARLTSTDAEHAWATQRCATTQPLWARRSFFNYQGESLALLEVFLPEFFALNQSC